MAISVTSCCAFAAVMTRPPLGLGPLSGKLAAAAWTALRCKVVGQKCIGLTVAFLTTTRFVQSPRGVLLGRCETQTSTSTTCRHRALMAAMVKVLVVSGRFQLQVKGRLVLVEPC